VSAERDKGKGRGQGGQGGPLAQRLLLTNACRGDDVDEIILSDSGSLLEGSQTNFYAVTSAGGLVTAGEGVLEGTVRKIVLGD
jgi:branched-subunit amino acid aminotransferase/4-amino-4-deoxychorismate lyase